MDEKQFSFTYSNKELRPKSSLAPGMQPPSTCNRPDSICRPNSLRILTFSSLSRMRLLKFIKRSLRESGLNWVCGPRAIFNLIDVIKSMLLYLIIVANLKEWEFTFGYCVALHWIQSQNKVRAPAKRVCPRRHLANLLPWVALPKGAVQRQQFAHDVSTLQIIRKLSFKWTSKSKWLIFVFHLFIVLQNVNFGISSPEYAERRLFKVHVKNAICFVEVRR